MRIGPKERAILLACQDDGFTPPSIYMGGDYGQCPLGHTLNRVVDKGLAVFRYMTWSAEEALAHFYSGERQPGRETAEFNAALQLTPFGVAKRAELLTTARLHAAYARNFAVHTLGASPSDQDESPF